MKRMLRMLCLLMLMIPMTVLANEEGENEMPKFVSTEWLAEHLDDEKLVLIDSTVLFNNPEGEFIESGQAWYDKEHIEGAVFADLFALNQAEAPIPFTVGDHDQFVETMEALGVSDDSKVVIYDAVADLGADYRADMWASRLAWQLNLEGFDNVSVLEGGLQKWKAEGRPVTDAKTEVSPGTLNIDRRDGQYISLEKMHEIVEAKDPNVVILDVLSPDQYSGAIAPFGEGRHGHIPGAVNVSYTELANKETGERMPEEELRKLFEASDVLNPEKEVVVYCGFGVAACYVRDVLNSLGQVNVRVYDGSLMEWATQSDYPLEHTEDPAPVESSEE